MRNDATLIRAESSNKRCSLVRLITTSPDSGGSSRRGATSCPVGQRTDQTERTCFKAFPILFFFLQCVSVTLVFLSALAGLPPGARLPSPRGGQISIGVR